MKKITNLLVHIARSIDHVSVIALFVLFIGVKGFTYFLTSDTSVPSKVQMLRLYVTVQVVLILVDIITI